MLQCFRNYKNIFTINQAKFLTNSKILRFFSRDVFSRRIQMDAISPNQRGISEFIPRNNANLVPLRFKLRPLFILTRLRRYKRCWGPFVLRRWYTTQSCVWRHVPDQQIIFESKISREFSNFSLLQKNSVDISVAFAAFECKSYICHWQWNTT